MGNSPRLCREFYQKGKRTMIPAKVKCQNCGSDVIVHTYRRFVRCPYCNSRFPFQGFEYQEIDWTDRNYAHARKWMDCPACRSRNMYCLSFGRAWKCPDCGHQISRLEKMTGVFWFCDDCETYLNVQPGFTTKDKAWKCTECGSVNDVTKHNISQGCGE